MAKADWKRWGFSWCLQVDTFSIEQVCSGKEVQMDDVEREKTHNEKLLVGWSGQKICVRRR